MFTSLLFKHLFLGLFLCKSMPNITFYLAFIIFIISALVLAASIIMPEIAGKEAGEEIFPTNDILEKEINQREAFQRGQNMMTEGQNGMMNWLMRWSPGERAEFGKWTF